MRDDNSRVRRVSSPLRSVWKPFVEPLDDRNLLAASATLLKDIVAGSTASNPKNFTEVGPWTYFTAGDSHGYELWRTNGTSAGTAFFKDINPGPNSAAFIELLNVNGTLYFGASDGSETGKHGYELWKSNGTTAGTVLVKDINPGTGGSGLTWFTNVNGTLFFAAQDASHGLELWKSNGTSAGTVLVKDINSNIVYDQSQPSDPTGLVNVNGTLFFAAHSDETNIELYKSNGTSAGTVMVRDIRPGTQGSYPEQLINYNGKLFFQAYEPTHGHELWTSNGTSAGTVVFDVWAGTLSSSPSGFTVANNLLFFTANDGSNQTELWKSNGTSAGTALVKDINDGGGSYPLHITNVRGILYFNADDGTHGDALWRSNGTSAGTSLVAAIPGGAPVENLVNAGGYLFFTADDGNAAHGRELWGSSGTSAGTVLVKDIRPGGFDGRIMYEAVSNGVMYFQAFETTHGAEVWIAKPPNTAPTLNAAKTPVLLPVVKNAPAPSGAVGTPVSSLVDISGPLRNVIDPDFKPLLGIAVTSAPATNGTWYFTINNGTTWTPIGNLSNGSARLLTADAASRIYFKPNTNFQGSVAITFRAWDRVGGTNGALISTLANGGGTTFSSATDTAAVLVNNAPDLDTTKSPTLTSIPRNSGNPVGAVGTLVSKLVDFKTPTGQVDNVTDINTGALLGIAVTRVDVTNGTWFYSTNNGSTWLALAANTTVAKLLAADASTRLYFKPTAGFHGTIAQAISFRAWDRTAGANGGTLNVSTFTPAGSFSRLGDTASIVVT
jgi:ELWxxDGT repeat protein